MASVKPICRTDKINKSGLAPLKIRIIENRKSREISIGLSINPNHWDSNSARVLKTHPNSTRINKLIVEKESEYLDLAIDINRGKKSVQQQSIREALGDGSELDFLEYMEGIAEAMDEDKKYGYASEMRTAKNRLKRFCDFLGRKSLNFGDFSTPITYKDYRNKESFLQVFERYQRNELGLVNQSIYVSSLRISKTFNKAIEVKDLDKKYYPMDDYSAPKGSHRRDYLTREQLDQVFALNIPEGSYKDLARDMYLFCALGGGLRFADCAKLRWKDIQNGSLDVMTGKTKAHLWFNLGEVPLQILNKHSSRFSKPNGNDLVFPCLAEHQLELTGKKAYMYLYSRNSKLNRGLRKISEELGFSHPMRFHSSRHTFATLAVRAGMKVTTLQKILGHRDITTTQIYWHILGADLEEDNAKFNQAGQRGVRELSEVSADISLIQLYILQTARVMKGLLGEGVEGIVVNSMDLEAYSKEMRLPVLMRKQVVIRSFLVGDGNLNLLADSLNRDSLFGDGLRFEVCSGRMREVEGLAIKGNHFFW